MVKSTHLPETALEQYAKLLNSDSKRRRREVEPGFPMYTLPLEIFLLMSDMEPHEELMADNKLVIFQKGMGKAAFVSHQWVGIGHPDPEFKQMRVLQESLQNLVSGDSQVSVDLITEFVYFRSAGIPTSVWTSHKLFLWIDYFSCPQLERFSNPQNLQKAIDSIPAYVSKCDFFMALCPVVESSAADETFSEYTWSQRGWCCMEKLVYELTTHDGAWILIKSPMHQELKLTPLTNSSPGEGSFSIQSDRARVGMLLQTFLKRKMLSCLEKMDLAEYRLVLNRQPAFLRGLGVPLVEAMAGREGDGVLASFLRQNGFRNVTDYDSAGWSPLCYACLGGRADVVQALLGASASPNDRTRKPLRAINLDKNSPVLSIGARFKNYEVMELLIAARAEVNSKAVHAPLGVACLGDDARGVTLLCSARADPHARNPYGDHALRMAAAAGASHAIDALLSLPSLSAPFDFSMVLHNAVMLQGGSVEVVRCLIDAQADINEQYQSKMDLLGVVIGVKALQYRLSKPTMTRRVSYHIHKATPLMLALLCGNFQAASTMVLQGALLDVRNCRGKTAMDFAREVFAPRYLMERMEGEAGRAFSIISCSSLKASPAAVSPEEEESGASSSSFFEI
ncbi:anks1b [Symbiodinium natans]|uniref:Anks1b protein n=1 Tax=Symbiodinium natans TaxID=878477 RepID=A0A812N9A4_9DINO|nr:anks1b [Symbiodinium natans]